MTFYDQAEVCVCVCVTVVHQLLQNNQYPGLMVQPIDLH